MQPDKPSAIEMGEQKTQKLARQAGPRAVQEQLLNQQPLGEQTICYCLCEALGEEDSSGQQGGGKCLCGAVGPPREARGGQRHRDMVPLKSAGSTVER